MGLQTEDQYIFIHDAVLEAVICGNTEVHARNLQAHVQSLISPDPGDNVTPMEMEFRVSSTFLLPSFAFLRSDFNDGSVPFAAVINLEVPGITICQCHSALQQAQEPTGEHPPIRIHPSLPVTNPRARGL